MEKVKQPLLFVAICLGLLSSCKTDTKEAGPQPTPVTSSMLFKISYAVDAYPLIFDSLMYYNDAGNHYSVTHLEYFLSQISLIKSDSSPVLIKDYQYLNADLAKTNQFTITDIPEGNYIGVTFNIGVDAAHNVTGGLPNISENNFMEWPVPMGGGYHFMKFEGDFLRNDTLFGFTLHLGRNENLVKVNMYSPVSLTHSTMNYTLVMNVNEWFRNPASAPPGYDLIVDGSSSMGDSLAMAKLALNGTHVFFHY
jgi:hypothetical protein